MAEGRRLMRLAERLDSTEFEALVERYQRVVCDHFEASGGRDVEATGDTVVARFERAEDAAAAAVAVHGALAALEWPGWPQPGASVAIASDESACEDLCDTAELGQTFVAESTARLLGDRTLRDLGEARTRRSDRPVRAYELT
jgi:class 3 adenylate cyclase